MAKARVAIPKKISDAVLKEYGHKCAICGAPEPHIHHIDEDPANNDPFNLLPLCPNHHLGDQHYRTRVIEPGILRLFRRYKDSTILGKQFPPLYQRFRFLEEVVSDADIEHLSEKVEELLRFLAVLNNGAFYEPQIRKLIETPVFGTIEVLGTRHNPETARVLEGQRQRYIDTLRKNSPDAIALIIQMLRYQNWSSHPEATAR